jgi:4-hydroxybenzoate polyprenyltransferase
MLQSVDLAFIQKRLDAYERLIRLDKPIGILLLLWPTLWRCGSRRAAGRRRRS